MVRVNSARDSLIAAPKRSGSDETGGPVISVERLRKSYGSLQAVYEVSFAIGRGEIFALLGPNGAGKTTTVEILEGYRAGDSGVAHVLGLDPIRDAGALKPHVGVMLQEDGVYPGLSASELLRLYASYYAEPRNPPELLERVGLTSVAGTRCRRLSGGQKRRLALALALVGRPAVLFLDEPTTGMDPQARLATWEILREERTQGTTVLLTTHFMDEAERLADRVAIMDAGRIVALDRPAALTGSASAGQIRFLAEPGLDCSEIARLAGADTAREVEPGVYVIQTARAHDLLVALTVWLRDRGVLPSEVRVGHGSLEEVFLRLTGREQQP